MPKQGFDWEEAPVGSVLMSVPEQDGETARVQRQQGGVLAGVSWPILGSVNCHTCVQ